MLGVEARQLNYWERLQLLRPNSRWGERFYSFDDLVAIRTLKQLVQDQVPARRLRRAIKALENQFGQDAASLPSLRVLPSGRDVVVIPPAPNHRPIRPLTGQYVLPFRVTSGAAALHTLKSRTADDWFALALAADGSTASLPRAVDFYRRAIALRPHWTAAHINLGTALYQLAELAAARVEFEIAIRLEAENATAHFNLGCVLDDLAEFDLAILHFRRATELSPEHADAHFNLALVLEKHGQHAQARGHWQAYVRLEPRGAWSSYARHRSRTTSGCAAPIPFPKR
jgi:tetratricopeptide (TPR) repeat protein